MSDTSVSNERSQNRRIPNVDVPEKIILCIDCCESENITSAFSTLKRLVSFFLYTKRAIDTHSEFALIVFKQSTPIWMHSFTKNAIEILMALDGCETEICDEKEFDPTALSNMIYANVDLPELGRDYASTPPPYIIRTVFIYGRSDCVPKPRCDGSHFDKLMKHVYFIFDVLYLYEEDHNEDDRSKIIERLQSLGDDRSYIFAAPRGHRKMFDCGAKLLAHPLQRPMQKDARYDCLLVVK
jgi:BRISC and BRCA1-A complex member 1